MTKLLDDIRLGLLLSANYSAVRDNEVLWVTDRDAGSEYIIEAFEDSIQIRQTVTLDCHELPDEELSRIYVLCSLMNQRFSGCKSCVDQWWALSTSADILAGTVTISHIETVLGQIEYISLAMLDLVEIMRTEERLITNAEIDAALQLPSLQ